MARSAAEFSEQLSALPAWKNGRENAPVFEVHELLLSVVSWFTDVMMYIE
jgi:hypothetical protein